MLEYPGVRDTRSEQIRCQAQRGEGLVEELGEGALAEERRRRIDLCMGCQAPSRAIVELIDHHAIHELLHRERSWFQTSIDRHAELVSVARTHADRLIRCLVPDNAA